MENYPLRPANPEWDTASFQSWMHGVRLESNLEVVEIPIEELPTWKNRNGVLQHETGRYFSITGIRVTTTNSDLAGLQQPIILQPEIGILGFLMRFHAGRCELLVQAKVEPGNVGEVQLAPTVQATKSNYMRVHGGAPTQYLRFFTEPEAGTIVSDSLQSEQGTRFLGKYNRNVAVLVKDCADTEPANHLWRWCSASSLLESINEDFTVNTDARSVMVCTPWTLLAPSGIPFERWKGSNSLGGRLLDSFQAREGQSDLPVREALERLALWRAASRFKAVKTKIEAVHPLRPESIPTSGVQIRSFRINVNGREVDAWDQPFLAAPKAGRIVVICQRRSGVLHFMMRGRAEVGFSNRIQLGPSIQDDGTDQTVDPLSKWFDHVASVEHLACMQSDEGGRFYRQSSRYSIAEIEPHTDIPEGERILWLTLNQIHTMLKIQGCFSNEARSALSMILTLL